MSFWIKRNKVIAEAVNLAGRPVLPKSEDAPIVAADGGVPPVASTRDIPVYPQVCIVGVHPWSFDGLEDTSLYPSPNHTQWPFGYVPPGVRRQMGLHPKVSQATNNLKSAIIGEGGRAIPCVAPSHPDFKKAREIAELCDFAKRNVRGSYYQHVWQMLDAVHEGNKVSPVVMRDYPAGRYKDQRVLDQLHVWPWNSYTFHRNEFGDVNKLTVNVQGDRNVTVKEFPREKFFVMTFRPINGNPLGISCYAAAYQPWYRDVHTDTEEMAYMAQFGRPSVIIFAAEPPKEDMEEEPQPLFTADGRPVLEPDPDNPGSYRQREGYQVEANAIKFQSFKAGSVWSLEGGSDVKVAEARQGGADLFRFTRESNHRLISSAIYGTHQATDSERNVSTNNAEVGEGIAGLNVTYGKRMLEEAEENDIYRHIVIQNYGESFLDLLPICDYGSGMNNRLPKVFNSIVGFVSNGAMSKDQYWWFCATNGLPLPYPESEPLVVAVKGSGGGDKTGAKPPTSATDSTDGSGDAQSQ